MALPLAKCTKVRIFPMGGDPDLVGHRWIGKFQLLLRLTFFLFLGGC
jgi:hypothetical protein